MNERELLTLAAQAAGRLLPHGNPALTRPNEELRSDGGNYWFWPAGDSWNPLTDDGDALRLAVQCGIEVSTVDDEPGTHGRHSRACAGYATESDPRLRYVFEDHRGNLFSATRRAITRAAAEIGRAA